MRKIIPLLVLFTWNIATATAQYVNVRLNFPVGSFNRPVGNAPFYGGIWIEPEWRWQGGNYVCIPGYWSKPNRKGARWLPGRWQRTRRGYIWISGRWH